MYVLKLILSLGCPRSFYLSVVSPLRYPQKIKETLTTILISPTILHSVSKHILSIYLASVIGIVWWTRR